MPTFEQQRPYAYTGARLAGDSGLPDFARRLGALIRLRRQLHPERPYTNSSWLARQVSAAGAPIQDSYIGLLRRRQRDNPSGRVLAALSLVLECPASVWFDERAFNAEVERLESLLDEARRGATPPTRRAPAPPEPR